METSSFMSSPVQKEEQVVFDVLGACTIVVLGFSYCPSCKSTVQTLADLNIQFAYIDVVDQDKRRQYYNVIKPKIGDHSTWPVVLYQGEFLGGNSEFQALAKNPQWVDTVRSQCRSSSLPSVTLDLPEAGIRAVEAMKNSSGGFKATHVK